MSTPQRKITIHAQRPPGKCRCNGEWMWSNQHGRWVCDKCTTFMTDPTLERDVAPPQDRSQ